MRALRCNEWGSPDSLVLEDLPDPVAGPGEVVVAAEAAAVNYPDVLIAANKYQVSIPTPFTPGSEYAGVVESVGDGVTGVKVGDRVRGGGFVGAFAEKQLAPVGSLSMVPDGVSLMDAAAFNVAYATAYRVLRTVADTQQGDWVCVLGASGGVGIAAVQLAQVLGGRVVACASSAEKLEVCRAHGAEAVIDYDTEDLKLRLRELTDGGADVVVDPVGGRYSEEALRSTRSGGRFVVVGFATGVIPRIPLNLVLLKGAVIKGYDARQAGADARASRELDELFASGRVRPYVSEVFPLSHAADALAAVAGRRTTGKVGIDLTR